MYIFPTGWRLVAGGILEEWMADVLDKRKVVYSLTPRGKVCSRSFSPCANGARSGAMGSAGRPRPPARRQARAARSGSRRTTGVSSASTAAAAQVGRKAGFNPGRAANGGRIRN